MDLTAEILKGNPRAIAKGISLAENDSRKAQLLMKDLFPHTGKSAIVGITGAPGSGKSTLVDQLITQILKDKKKAGIIAVDPSSPFSGGAILGDRIRMMRHSENPAVFIRSMATRGQLGGLAKATGEAISILEAAGKEIVLIETVGVGQDEVEVVKMADVILVVLVPGAGDDIQAFKAGIMEIADIFVLNKADSPETARAEKQLKAMLDLGLKSTERPEIVKTVATQGEGIDLLYQRMKALFHKYSRLDQKKRKQRLVEGMLKDIVISKIYAEVEKIVSREELDSLVDKIYRRKLDPYSVSEDLIRRVKGG